MLTCLKLVHKIELKVMVFTFEFVLGNVCRRMQVSSAKDVTKNFPLSQKIDSAKMRQSQTPRRRLNVHLH